MTKAEAQNMLTLYLDAEKKVLLGQSVSHNGKSWTMADLDKIRAGRAYWQRVVTQFEGRRRAAQATFPESP